MESNGSFTSLEIKADLEHLVAKHFDGLHSGGGRSSIKGGQTAANEALAKLDLRGYAKDRNEVLPIQSQCDLFSAWRGKLDMNNQR